MPQHFILQAAPSNLGITRYEIVNHNNNKKNLKLPQKPQVSVPGGVNHRAYHPGRFCASLFISLCPATSLKVHQKIWHGCSHAALRLSLICLTIVDLLMPRSCVQIDFAWRATMGRSQRVRPPPTSPSRGGGTVTALHGVIAH